MKLRTAAALLTLIPSLAFAKTTKASLSPKDQPSDESSNSFSKEAYAQCNIGIEVPSNDFKDTQSIRDKTKRVGRKGKLDLQHLSKDCQFAGNIEVSIAGTKSIFKMNTQEPQPIMSADRKESKKKNSFTSGEDTDGSMINLLYNPDGNLVAGSIVDVSQDTVIQIGIDSEGNRVVDITSSSDFPPEADPIEEFEVDDMFDIGGGNRLLFNSVPTATNTTRRTDTGDVTIDILVVWTEKAECKNAGLNDDCNVNDSTKDIMDTLIQLAIEETNAAFKNSGVGIVLELVHSYRSSYVEPNKNAFQTSLRELRGNGDRKIDEVHDLREQHGADIVSMIIHDDDYCGIGKW